jgi:hypothetical protein
MANAQPIYKGGFYLSFLLSPTYKGIKMTVYCDYDTSRGFSPSEGLGCFKGIAKHKVVITYSPSTETDTLKLCDECLKRLRHLARKQKYKIKTEPLLPPNLDQTEEWFTKRYPLMFQH